MIREAKSLGDWSLDSVRELLAGGVFETDWFDFKERLPHSGDEKGKERLRKTVVAFANSGDGYLVLGVKDDKGLPATERLVGIAPTVDIPEHFGALASGCQPSVKWQAKNPPIPLESGHVVHVIHVPLSVRRPHAIENGGAFYFPKRTNKGNETMSYEEVRMAFQGTEYRRTKLALLASELEHLRSTAQAALEQIPSALPAPGRTFTATWTTRYSTVLLDMVLGDAYSFLAEDASIWADLAAIRATAQTSNATAEGFMPIAYLMTDNKDSASRNQQDRMRGYAATIAGRCDGCIPKVRALLVT